MRVYQSGRRTGKTTQLVNWLRLNDHGVLIVHSAHERARIIKEYDNVDADRIFTVQTILDRSLLGRVPRPTIAIDNLDLILPYILGGSIGPITMTPTLNIIREDGNDW